MKDYSRCREKVEGWLGRRRWYYCRQCGAVKFQVDTVGPLPELDRICPICPSKRAVSIKEKEEPLELANDSGAARS